MKKIDTKNAKIAIVVFTLNPGPSFATFFESVTVQTCKSLDLILVDSGSTDCTVPLSKWDGFRLVNSPKSDFNHGATREMARKLSGADIVVLMTQDAIAVNSFLIEKLVEPIIAGKASFSYARQIPRKKAGFFEAFPRHFNYPEESHIRGIEDVDKYGVYTFFCSNSCAAYLNSALDEIGGFCPTLTNEDYFVAARLLQKGHKIAYVAEAMIEHSHPYTLCEEFKRYFDTGYVRAENPWVQQIVGQAEGRGKQYFKELLSVLLKTKPWLIPYAIVNSFVKLLGFRVGYYSLNAPKWWKKMMSGQSYFWDSKFY